MSRKRKNLDSGSGANWMDTYGDMVTLILTFFVLLYSFSTVDVQKWEKLVAALGGQNGVLVSGSGAVQENIAPASKDSIESQPVDSSEQVNTKSSEELYEKLEEHIEKNQLSKDISVSRSLNEIKISFTNNVLFDLGKADLRGEALPILNGIADAIKTYGAVVDMIRIEGHTDNLPISTREFPSNWELSVERSVSVLKYMLNNQGIDPSIISAAGYGEYHPVADNSTEDGRKQNRRVDFVILVIQE